MGLGLGVRGPGGGLGVRDARIASTGSKIAESDEAHSGGSSEGEEQENNDF